MIKLEGISAFFPAYNEEGNIERMVKALKGVLPQVADDFEILVVNDGSKDKTREIADRLAREDDRVRAIHHERNLGYGAAIRSGIQACKKEYVFFTDGDNQFDVSQLTLLVSLISSYDGVLGFRLNRQDPWVRKANAWAWNRLVRLLLGLKVRDINCAFKLLRTRIFDQVHLEYTGAMISTEMLVKIVRNGYKIREVGVLHTPRLTGVQTGANLRVILRAFRELFLFYKKMKGKNI